MITDEIKLTIDELKFGMDMIKEIHFLNNIKSYDEAIQLINYRFNEGFFNADEFKMLVKLEKKYWDRDA